MRNYLEHNFPVILHDSVPVRLDKELREKLNSFLPIYRQIFERIVLTKGLSKDDFAFLQPRIIMLGCF